MELKPGKLLKHEFEGNGSTGTLGIVQKSVLRASNFLNDVPDGKVI